MFAAGQNCMDGPDHAHPRSSQCRRLFACLLVVGTNARKLHSPRVFGYEEPLYALPP